MCKRILPDTRYEISNSWSDLPSDSRSLVL